MTGTMDWRGVTAPSLEEFEVMAATAWERLPVTFRQLCGDLVIRVEDFATDEVLDELGIESEFDLLGLYQGVSLDKKSLSDLPRDPDMVLLYRRAILDYWVSEGDRLGDIITHVLVHEIGHHFGFSDADMEEIEAEASEVRGDF